MALERNKMKEIPSDAIMLSEDEALKYHYQILNNWTVQSDIFGYKYGTFLLSAGSMLSGAYINNHFRRKLKLSTYGRIASYLPICVMPGILSFVVHHEVVLKDLVLLKQNQCPICLEIRASTIQSFFGFIVPLTVTAISSLGLAHRFGTYNLPLISSEPLKVLKLTGKLLKPIKNILFGILVGQALLGSAVTYFEAKSIYNVDFKLSELEKKLENSANMQQLL